MSQKSWDRVVTEAGESGTEQCQPWFSIWQGVWHPPVESGAPLHLGPLGAGLTEVRSQEQMHWGALQTFLQRTVQSSIAKAAGVRSRELTGVLLLSFPQQVIPLRASFLERRCSGLGDERTQLKCFLHSSLHCRLSLLFELCTGFAAALF